MAEDTSVKEPTEATEQPQHTSAVDKPADKQSENTTAPDEKPAGKVPEIALKLLLKAGLAAVDPSLCDQNALT